MDVKCWTYGKSLEDVCPSDLRSEYGALKKEYFAILKSFTAARIDTHKIRLVDQFPVRFKSEWEDINSQIMDYVVEQYPKPSRYDELVAIQECLSEMENRPLRIRREKLKPHFAKAAARRLYKKLDTLRHSVKYNMWGTVTGRLTTESGYFPILTMNKEFRDILEPNNDWFIELDFNSAELRVAFYLMGHQQPKEDIHNWIKENVYKTKITRDRLKAKTFAWLYNPDAENHRLESILDKKKISASHYASGCVETPFERKIEAPPEKALNYLIQSTTSDLFLRQMVKVHKLLEDRKSYVAFCVHDSLVLDFKHEDKKLLREILDAFKNTEFGEFKINMSAGINYGNLKEITI